MTLSVAITVDCGADSKSCTKPCSLLPPPAAHRRLCHRLRLAQSVRVTDSHKADSAGAIEEKPIKKGRLMTLYAS